VWDAQLIKVLIQMKFCLSWSPSRMAIMVSLAVTFSLFLGTRMILRPIQPPPLGSLHEIEDQSCNVYHSNVDNDVYLVFIHGLGGQIPQFADQIRYFSQKYNVIAIDLVGHGKSRVSDNEEDYKLDAHVERIYTILSHLNVLNKKLIIVGHSLGCLLGNLLSQKISVQGFIAIAPSTNISEKLCAQAHKFAKLPVWALEILRFFDRFAGTHSPSVNRMLRPKASLEHRRKQLAFNMTTPTKVIRNMARGMRPLHIGEFKAILPKLAIVHSFELDLCGI
jgi:pimeloyl-ACP methyl ester carboxylesterase